MKNARDNRHNGQHDYARVLLAAFTVAFYPELGFAASAPVFAVGEGTVGDIFCNVFHNASGFPPLFSAIAYMVGGWIVVRGLFDMMKRSSDPNNKPFKDGLLGIFMGGMVAALPQLIAWLHKTIFPNAVVGGDFTCGIATPSDPSGAPVPLDEMMANFVDNIKHPIVALVSALAVILGVAMVFYNMVKLSKFGTDAKTNTLTPIIGSLIIGAMLIAVGETMDVSLNTLFGFDEGANGIVKYETVAYVPGGSFDMTRFDRAIKSVFIFLYIVGSISFVRGFFIMKNALEGQGQATKGQAYTHIIGGTLLVNMPGFIEFIERTIGFDIIRTTR